MEKEAKKAASPANSALTRQYGSIAEIKREFFPNAAAEDEAEAAAGRSEDGYENLMDEFFGQHQQSSA